MSVQITDDEIRQIILRRKQKEKERRRRKKRIALAICLVFLAGILQHRRRHLHFVPDPRRHLYRCGTRR